MSISQAGRTDLHIQERYVSEHWWLALPLLCGFLGDEGCWKSGLTQQGSYVLLHKHIHALTGL